MRTRNSVQVQEEEKDREGVRRKGYYKISERL